MTSNLKLLLLINLLFLSNADLLAYEKNSQKNIIFSKEIRLNPTPEKAIQLGVQKWVESEFNGFNVLAP